MKNMLKTNGIPMWVTIFALIAFAMGCATGLMGIFSQGMEGINESMSISWGGRSFGLGLAAGVAVFLKNSNAYIVAFVGSVSRDIGDLIAHMDKTEPSIGVIIGILVFLIPGIVDIVIANKARKL
ncbi:MAG: hypothetical protein V3R65_02525 [Acidiferrobacterales bacterium]